MIAPTTPTVGRRVFYGAAKWTTTARRRGVGTHPVVETRMAVHLQVERPEQRRQANVDETASESIPQSRLLPRGVGRRESFRGDFRGDRRRKRETEEGLT